MTKPIHEMSSWDASAHPPHVVEEDEAWEATRAQASMATQLMRDKDDPQTQRHVGRQIGPSQWELFVVIDPAEALQQQFEVLRPEFIALHDLGTQSSRRMLAGLSAATGQPVHQLHIRRQGLGLPLARLEFVELPLAAGLPPLRLYTTEVDADTQQRHRLARTLLAHSRLGVVLVGDLPPHALATALSPLREAIRADTWLNRELLMLPLAGGSTLSGLASQLALGSAVRISTTPKVARPADAWTFLLGTWSKLRVQLREQAVHLPEIVDLTAPTNGTVAATTAPVPIATPAATSLLDVAGTARAPLPMQPMPIVRAAQVAKVDPALATYISRCFELKGLVSCCIFELATQRTVAHTGARPGPAALASQGASLMASITEAAQTLHLGAAAPDAMITLGAHHQLLRAVPRRPGLALHAVLDRETTNLTLARLQLQRLDLLLDEPDDAA